MAVGKRCSALPLSASGLKGDGRIEAKAWAAAQAHHRRDGNDTQAYWLTVTLERSVRGELALVALRVMRELGVRHGVPFKTLDDRPHWKLPTDLAPVADHIIEQVLAGSSVMLDPDQERLLRSRYIHQSAHWTPTKGVMLAKPAPDKDGKTIPAHTEMPGDVVIDYPEAERRIGFTGPADQNYEGLTCTVTMDDGTTVSGVFGSDNKANVYPNTGNAAVIFEMDDVAKDEQVPSAAEALMKDLLR